MVKPTLLPWRLPPCREEAFSSWTVRLAAVYGLKTRSLCSVLSGKAVEFGADMDAMAGAATLGAVAARIGFDPAEVRAGHTLAGWEGRLFEKLHPAQATPWVLPLGPFYSLRPAMQYCSLCLREPTAYYRRTWRLSLFCVCPIHAVGLRHVCQRCASATHPIKNDLRWGAGDLTRCWQCGFDLRDADAEGVEEQDALLAGNLLRVLSGEVLPANAPMGADVKAYFAGLAMLCARLLRRHPRLRLWRATAAEAAGVVSLPAPADQRVSNNYDSLIDPTERRPVLRTASWLLGEWPKRFLDVARAAHTRTSDFVSHFATAPAWFLEPLQTHLTPSRRKPVVSPGVLRARRMRQFILDHRSEWSASKLPRLIRAMRAEGYYSPETDDGVIMRSLPGTIATLRVEGADYRRRLTRQVERDTPEWSRLILQAKPYRKAHCQSTAILRRGIRLLCTGRFLSSADLGELLRRSHVVLMVFHLTPMVRAGELETRFPLNRGGSRNFPGQAYRSLPTSTDPRCANNPSPVISP